MDALTSSKDSIANPSKIQYPLVFSNPVYIINQHVNILAKRVWSSFFSQHLSAEKKLPRKLNISWYAKFDAGRSPNMELIKNLCILIVLCSISTSNGIEDFKNVDLELDEINGIYVEKAVKVLGETAERKQLGIQSLRKLLQGEFLFN